MDAFKEQVFKYKNEPFSDFRRMNLAYAFQDLVKTFTPHSQSDVTESIAYILDLQITDPALMRAIGYDLLETSVKLHLLFGTESLKTLYDFSKTIAFESSPKEILLQINLLMEVFLSDSDEPGYEFLRSPGKTEKNVFKAVITFYLSIIISKIEEKHLKNTMGELKIYVRLLNSGLLRNSEVLGLGIIEELVEGIRGRSLALKVNAQVETLSFLMSLVVVYVKTAAFEENFEKVVGLVQELFGDLGNFLEIWEKKKLEKGLEFYEAVLALATRVCTTSSLYKLPMVLSPQKRFQVLLLNSIKAAEALPQAFLQVFDHVNEYLPGNLLSSSLFYQGSPYKSPNEMFLGLVEACGKLENNEQKRRSWTGFQNLLEKLEAHSKFQATDYLIGNLQWDKARSMLLDWVRTQYLSQKIDGEVVVKLVWKSLEADVFEEFIETLQSATLAYKALIPKVSSERVSKKLQSIFKTLKKLPYNPVHSYTLMHLQDLFPDNGVNI